jgi:hypothetical protein
MNIADGGGTALTPQQVIELYEEKSVLEEKLAPILKSIEFVEENLESEVSQMVKEQITDEVKLDYDNLIELSKRYKNGIKAIEVSKTTLISFR